jgi:hypothetical protein
MIGAISSATTVSSAAQSATPGRNADPVQQQSADRGGDSVSLSNAAQAKIAESKSGCSH